MRPSWISDEGGGVGDGVGGSLGGCLILALIVDMFDPSVLYLAALFSFLTIGCGSQHAQHVL